MAVGKAGDPALHGRSALSLIELACHDEDALVYTLCTTFEQGVSYCPIFIMIGPMSYQTCFFQKPSSQYILDACL